MSARFEELDWRRTAIGELSLRRRLDPVTGVDVHEVKLGDEFLMSSLFTVAEVELARLALARLSGSALDVVVGGLGLGYTAQAVLADVRVRELLVVEALAPVIEWHQRGLVPVGPALTGDPRCRLLLGDFFALSASPDGFSAVDPEPGFDASPPVRGLDPGPQRVFDAGPQRVFDAGPQRVFDAVLVDIDHSPVHLLAGGSAGFYTPTGTRSLTRHLRPGGCYALWSNDPPDEGYLATLSEEFVDVTAEVVRFANPLQDREATNTVYLGTRADT
jgi:hypothetical protein